MVNPTTLVESIQLPNSVATQYTSTSAVQTVIKKLTLTNSDTVAGYFVTIYLVPAGGAAAPANLLIFQRAIGPKQTLDVTEAVNQILNPSDFLAAFADTAGKVNMRVSGVQITS